MGDKVLMVDVVSHNVRGKFTEIGYTGLKRFGGILHEEFLAELRGRQGREIFREMSDNDAVIGSFLYAIEQAIRRIEWYVDPPVTDRSNEAMRATMYVRSLKDDMSHSWADTISEILSMLIYGFSYFEVVLKFRRGDFRDPTKRSKFNDGLLGWRKLAIRGQDTTDRWEFDDTGGIRGMWQLGPPTYERVFLPISRSLLFRTKITKNNPEGRSILRNAYRSWYFKKNIEEIEAIGVERDLAGLPVIGIPEEIDLDSDENAPLRTFVTQLISNLRRDEQDGVALPFGWSLTLLGSPGKRQFDVNEIINRYEKRIAATSLAQFILLGLERIGSFALARDQKDLFLRSLQGWVTSIASVFNLHAIPKIVRMSGFNLTEYPVLRPGFASEPNLKDLAMYINQLVSANVLQPDDELEQYLRRVAQLSEAPRDLVGVPANGDGRNRNGSENSDNENNDV